MRLKTLSEEKESLKEQLRVAEQAGFSAVIIPIPIAVTISISISIAIAVSICSVNVKEMKNMLAVLRDANVSLL